MSAWKQNSLWFVICFFCWTSSLTSHAQQSNILFYNVENLFDTYDDSLKFDEEFTPGGLKYWNTTRYVEKLKHISRVIYESGAFNLPVFIGLAEIENRSVLADLLEQSGLDNLGYKIIHFDSPDARGIDAAVLYRENQFLVDSVQKIRVCFEADSRPTRDILHVSGWLPDSLYCHLYVNHWPSRYGGVEETMHKRLKVSELLINEIASLTAKDSLANIIVMGDFNDNPEDESLQQLVNNSSLINLSLKSRGTLKHQHQWYQFDQMLISSSLKQNATLKVLDFDYLLEKDDANTGNKPNRTYVGYKYHGGYSDHLPIMLTLQKN